MEWIKAVIVPLAAMSSLAQAQDVLKVYNWADYIDPADSTVIWPPIP